VKAIKGDQSDSSMHPKTAGELPGKDSADSRAKFSKGDARYWLVPGRLFKDESADYSCRFSVRGTRGQFCLATSNQAIAAKRASELFTIIITQGWDAGCALYRTADKKRHAKASFGTLIATATKLSTARRHSLDAYTKALRCIVAEIKGIKAGENAAGKGSAHAAWREKVDAVPLADITPAEVMAWKNSRLRAAESDPLAKRRAAVTVNSLMRNAKALFGKKLLPFIEQSVTIPRPLPFDGVTFEKPPSMRYVSRVDAFGILAVARQELADKEPEAFKVLLLALVCGLRRSEIDNLLWRSFDFGRKVLRVESTEFKELKSEDSAGEIDLDDDTLAIFRGFRAKNPKAVFVIESPNKPRSEMKARCYRCDSIFKRVLEWLRAQGVEASKPLHTMRKEIGSIIASEHGIFEASRYLRHSDIRITSAIYADKKKTVTPKSFDGLLRGAASVPIDQAKVPKTKKRKA
jgi:integrase